MRHLFRRGGVGRRGVIVGLVVAVASLPAFAAIGGAAVTTPTAGAVVRDVGPVTIHEDTGGQFLNATASALCNGSSANRSPRATGRIQVIRQSDNTTVVDITNITDNSLAAHGEAFDAIWDTTTAQPGMYRILSTAVNVTRATILSQCLGTNVTNSDFLVEFRPWQHTFRDILNTGSVSMNTAGAREFSYKVQNQSSDAVIDGTTAMKLFAVGDPSSFTLPEDPTVCTTDPLACLPPTAELCANTGPCNARLAVVKYEKNPKNKLYGIFDLQTKAFIASASANGTTRILASLGPDLDAELTALLGSAVTALQDGTGIDVANLLATKVRLRVANGPGGDEVSIFLSIAELLEIVQGPSTGPTGANLLSTFTVNAGYMLHTVSGIAAPGSVGGPYTVSESQLVPSVPLLAVPAAPPLLVVEPGGKLKHIEGNYPGLTGNHTAGAAATSNALDTAPDEPQGLPAWLPVLSQGGTLPDGDMDFIGHALALANVGIDLGDAGVLKVGILLGFGASIFGDNPLPIGLGDLPLVWDPQDPQIVALVDAINGAAGDVLADPAVQDLLGQLLGSVPAV